MIDTASVIRDYLLSDTALAALVGERIWAERVVPPAGYTPSVGPSIVFRNRGGQVLAQGSVVAPSVQFKCYAPADSLPAEVNANAVYRALYDAIERDGGGYGVKSCTVEVLGQTLSEPDTGWIFVLTFASFWMNADA